MNLKNYDLFWIFKEFNKIKISIHNFSETDVTKIFKQLNAWIDHIILIEYLEFATLKHSHCIQWVILFCELHNIEWTLNTFSVSWQAVANKMIHNVFNYYRNMHGLCPNTGRQNNGPQTGLEIGILAGYKPVLINATIIIKILFSVLFCPKFCHFFVKFSKNNDILWDNSHKIENFATL